MAVEWKRVLATLLLGQLLSLLITGARPLPLSLPLSLPPSLPPSLPLCLPLCLAAPLPL